MTHERSGVGTHTDLTLSVPRRNVDFYPKFKEFDTSTPETTATQTGSERVRNGPDARARARWLAVSTVRFRERLGGLSHETQEPARW